MRYYINKNNLNFIPTLYNKFKIMEVNDIYVAIGVIIQQSQEWESVFKDLCKLNGLKLESLESATLDKMNIKLYNSGLLSEDEYLKLKEIISLRNKINYKFFYR